MSTDPAGQAVGDGSGLCRSKETGKHLHPHRVIGKPLAEGLHVLGGEQGGRDQHRHLFAVLDGLERGPHGDLGLAEAHITANETVHRRRGLHVCLYVSYGLQLVRRLVVNKGVLHFRLPRGVGAEGVTGRRSPLLVQGHELLGDLADRFAHPGLGLLPFAPVQTGKRGLFPPVYGRNASTWSEGTYNLSPSRYSSNK